MNLMTVEGYTARTAYDPESDLYRGEILGLSGGADFYAKSPTELHQEFKNSLAIYLQVCAEKGIDPRHAICGPAGGASTP